MKKTTFILILILLVSLSTKGQNDSLHIQNPKVGLVLSGGGAKGLAHIGALKTIDSLGVKIDYVAGTSMGAIIGGLYASGYSGKQIDSIFKTVDFDELINDNLPRNAKTFYERDNSEKYAITLPFNNFKVQIPSAISRGQNVFNLFSKLLLHISDIENFENLPIPFFCIATNIETGEPVVLNSGSLPQAIAASGALPSLFQPVIINNQILIDGGVVNNYPIDELKAKGMDIIIGVDVQDGLAERAELNSAPNILLQISNFRTINAMKDKAKKTDIYIKPDIKSFNVVSFQFGKQIIEKGRIAAIEKQDELKAIVQNQHHAPIKKIKIVAADSLRIKKIDTKGNDKYTRSYILGKLKLKPNETVSYDQFSKGINNIVATQNFDSFLYDFEPNDDGYDLIVYLKESTNKTFLKFGVHYDDLYKSAALVNITQKQLLFKNDLASFDMILGDNVRYNFEYYIDKGFYWSIGLRSRYNTFHKSVNASLFLDEGELGIVGLKKADIRLTDQTNQFFVQTLFRKDFSLKLGAEHKRLKITSETFVDESEGETEKTTFEKSDFFSVFGNLKFDTYNNKYFPDNGFLFDGNFQLYLSSSDFNNDFSQFSFAKANVGYAMSFSDKLSLLIGSEGGFKVGDDSNNSLSFALGGYGQNLINNFISFYGYDYISIIGDSFVKGTINIDYEIASKHHIGLAANYANVGNDLFTNGEWITAPDYSGYAIGYGLETFLGPVEIKYTWSPEVKQDAWFFNVGFWF
ncbi:MAG: patatin-like phospholipase family protein [Flavobacteriaceae bacterium]|nr:patatin-like phospholipase family protein [Flavobacteriaceae bacterium]